MKMQGDQGQDGGSASNNINTGNFERIGKEL